MHEKITPRAIQFLRTMETSRRPIRITWRQLKKITKNPFFRSCKHAYAHMETGLNVVMLTFYNADSMSLYLFQNIWAYKVIGLIISKFNLHKIS